jgi:hypothetical protein
MDIENRYITDSERMREAISEARGKKFIIRREVYYLFSDLLMSGKYDINI